MRVSVAVLLIASLIGILAFPGFAYGFAAGDNAGCGGHMLGRSISAGRDPLKGIDPEDTNYYTYTDYN